MKSVLEKEHLRVCVGFSLQDHTMNIQTFFLRQRMSFEKYEKINVKRTYRVKTIPDICNQQSIQA